MKTLKLLTIFMIVVFFFCSCKENNLGNDSKSDLELQNLKGKVHRIIENSYYAEYKFGEVHKEEKSTGQAEDLFNEQGKLIERKFINFFGNKVTNIYDDNGLELETMYFNEKGGLDSRTIYKHDEKGNRIEENYYDLNAKLERKNVAEYDEKKNVTKVESYKLDKLLNTSKYTYVYDKEGNKLEVKGSLYDLEGNLSDEIKDVNKYDSKGNLLQEMRFNLKGDLEHKYTYKYDKNDNEIEFCNYNSAGKLTYTRSKIIDDKGNIIEEERISNSDSIKEYNGNINECDIRFVPVNVLYNSEITRETYQYDNYGNVAKKTDYRGYMNNGVVVFYNECSKYYEYQYDDKKNWIVKYESVVTGDVMEKENVVKITEREIVYYK